MSEATEVKQSMLKVHEWGVIALIVGFLATIGLVNYRRNHEPATYQEPPVFALIQEVPTVTVKVTGAVKKETTLTLPKGATLQDLTDFLLIEDDADVSFLRKKRQLRHNEVITVPTCE